MAGRIRRIHSSELKTKIALEALKEEQTIAEIWAKYDIHPKLVGDWKQELIEHANLIFNRKKKEKNIELELKEKEQQIEELYKEVGQLTLEVNWAKKKVKQLA